MNEDLTNGQIEIDPIGTNISVLTTLINQEPGHESGRLATMLMGFLPNPHHEYAKTGMISEPYIIILEELPTEEELNARFRIGLAGHLAFIINNHLSHSYGIADKLSSYLNPQFIKRNRSFYVNRLFYNALCLAALIPNPEMLYKPLSDLSLKGNLKGSFEGIPHQYSLEHALQVNSPIN